MSINIISAGGIIPVRRFLDGCACTVGVQGEVIVQLGVAPTMSLWADSVLVSRRVFFILTALLQLDLPLFIRH